MSKNTKSYPKGHLLCVNHKFFEHVGISDGNGKVYENAYRTKGRGKVSLDEFSQGRKIIDIGLLPGSLDPDQIIEKAEITISDKKRYNFFFNNCEHFVREICGVKIRSPQIQQAILSAIIAALALKSKDTKIKGLISGAATGGLLSKNNKSFIKKSPTRSNIRITDRSYPRIYI